MLQNLRTVATFSRIVLTTARAANLSPARTVELTALCALAFLRRHNASGKLYLGQACALTRRAVTSA